MIRVLERGSVEAIGDALRQQRYHVLYVSCHAAPGRLMASGRAADVYDLGDGTCGKTAPPLCSDDLETGGDDLLFCELEFGRHG